MNADAIVIGGGPAGSTVAALLAERGHKVVVLEKSRFPRYHVGESLMPFCWFSLDRLGVVDRLNEIGFTRKNSVQFVTTDGRVSAPFYFFQHFDHPAATTWQVERSEFDQMLLENACAKGAEVREQTSAEEFITEGDRVVGVRAVAEEGGSFEVRAPLTLDCTGRDALYQRKHGWRQRDPKLNKVSIWTYFRGAKRDAGLDEGATTVAYLPGGGWFWNIPLRNDIVSSGIVAERDYLFRDTRDPAEIYAREIENNAWIKEHLGEGEQFGEYWVTGEYSYRSEHCATDGPGAGWRRLRLPRPGLLERGLPRPEVGRDGRGRGPCGADGRRHLGGGLRRLWRQALRAHRDDAEDRVCLLRPGLQLREVDPQVPRPAAEAHRLPDRQRRGHGLQRPRRRHGRLRRAPGTPRLRSRPRRRLMPGALKCGGPPPRSSSIGPMDHEVVIGNHNRSEAEMAEGKWTRTNTN